MKAGIRIESKAHGYSCRKVVTSASTVDTIDWKQERSAELILNTVLPKLSPGSIILCHNNGFRIKDYLPVLIEKAQEQGYTFVTMSELLLSGETTIDSNGMQKPATGAAQTPAPGATPASTAPTPTPTPAPKAA